MRCTWVEWVKWGTKIFSNFLIGYGNFLSDFHGLWNFFEMIKILPYIFTFLAAHNLENPGFDVSALHIAYTLMNRASVFSYVFCTLQNPDFAVYSLFTQWVVKQKEMLYHYVILLHSVNWLRMISEITAAQLWEHVIFSLD